MLCMHSIEGKLKELNSGKKHKSVYMHYKRVNFHQNLKKVNGDDGIRNMQKDIEDGNVKVVHLYRSYDNDLEVMDYIEGGVKCGSDTITERLQRRRELWVDVVMEGGINKNSSEGIGLGKATNSPIPFRRGSCQRMANDVNSLKLLCLKRK